MPNLQVRGVPADVHAALVHKAERAGQSLQQYLAAELTRLARTPTLDEVLDRIEERAADRPGARLSGSEAVAALEAERDRR
jgi:hypothetical protein